MSVCYALKASPDSSPQNAEDRTFLGGRPCLPPDQEMPTCRLCGAEQTLFFQVEFPKDHPWPNTVVALFACTACADEDRLIPEMLSGELRGADVPEGFLEGYQRNFRFPVFAAGIAVPRQDYRERIAFRRFHLFRAESSDITGSKVGGQPSWLLDDETPAAYGGRAPMVFLLQLEPGLRFETVPGAPAQMDLALDGTPEPATRRHYELFLGNALYLFGTGDSERRLVYAITQVE